MDPNNQKFILICKISSVNTALVFWYHQYQLSEICELIQLTI